MEPTIRDLVRVASFVNAFEAEVAKSALEAAGIAAVIHRDDCGGVRPSLWLSGVDLLVPRDEETRALELLDTPAIGEAADQGE